MLANLSRQTPFPNLNVNHIRPEDLPKIGQGVSPLSLRPWQIFSSWNPQHQLMAPNWGISNAWLGTLRVERHYQNGFGLALAYTLTSWIDNVIFTGGDDATFGDNQQIQNLYDLKGERSRSTNAVPHRLVVGLIWDLPFGHSRKWGGDWHPVVDGILGGWQMSFIGTLRSGTHCGLGVLDGPRNILCDDADGKNLRPDLVQGVSMYHPRTGQPRENGSRGIFWLNPDAFAEPPMFTRGSSSRTLPGVRGPKSISFDAMLAKNWRFTERYQCQFHRGMYNFTHTPQWNLPGQNLGASGFGFVGGAGGRRIMQFGMKLYS